MAQNVQIVLTDDIDGSEASETVRFGLDGREYEIDLNAEHASGLREALTQYVANARRASSGRGGARAGHSAAAGAGASGAPSGSGDTAKIRAWAKQNGYEVSERGRINAKVREAYQAAQS